MTYLERLEHAIREVHGCEAKHAATTAVTDFFRGKVAWQGEVETFDLVGHLKAKRAYAWGYEDGGKWDVVTVLEIPPVESPETAVRVAVAAAR
jgi:hypothetical protein